MSTATCARFCSPLTGANKASNGGVGSSSKLAVGSGSNMTSSLHNKKKTIPATNDSNTEATFTFKLSRNASNINATGSHSVASSESSDPLESDYSEETEEEEQPQQQQSKKPQSKHMNGSVSVSVSSRSSSSATSASVENEGEEQSNGEEAEQSGQDANDVTNNDSSDESEQDDGNETDDEETDDESEESSSVQTAKGVRKYHLDDYQIIKTNGADDVKRHRWFKHLNWNDVYNKKLKPPIMPDVHHDGDTKNFDDYPEKDWKPAKALDQRDLQFFNDF
ncbi:Pka-C3 [Drosophila busckii]|uniref:Pka-C3 n=1 Tax=Drosophila busckii TaxID=30019 RepID=A0A0M4EA91_DROBS|nr:Pka-C3 [Drosophila busckii]